MKSKYLRPFAKQDKIICCYDDFIIRSQIIQFKNHMELQNRNRKKDNRNQQILLYIGLVLSQTQIIINIRQYADFLRIPYFVFLILIFKSTQVTYIFLCYAFLDNPSYGKVLEMFEHIKFPIFVLLLQLLSQCEGFIEIKICCLMLLTFLGVLLIIKIIYFNSVSRELSQISTINKTFRIFKLLIVAILPFVTDSKIFVVLLLLACQIISISIFIFKFTYQKCNLQYVLLLGILCGFISAIQNLVQVIFQVKYFFIGELLSLFYFTFRDNFMMRMLQLKYINSLSLNQQNKSDDEYLANFIFLNECLKGSSRSINLSTQTVNEGYMFMNGISQRQANIMSQKQKGDQSMVNVIQDLINEKSQRKLQQLLFFHFRKRFYETDSFSCLQYTISCALQLGGIFINEALIIYYRYCERKKTKMSIFQSCKFKYLYQRIIIEIDAQENNKREKQFIQFSDNLKSLNKELQQALNSQISLIDFLIEKAKKGEMRLDQRLYKRNKQKYSIRKRLNKCLQSRLYASSNQFKFLFLLYNITIQKQYECFKESIKNLFLSSDYEKKLSYNSKSILIVLSGFNHGQILNSNQYFKIFFASNLNNYSKNNISQFLLSQKQKSNHNYLMNECLNLKSDQFKNHSKYDCYITIEKEFGPLKLKIIKKMKISVRIYYENNNQFNYMCCLDHQQIPKDNENFFVLKKQIQNIESKGIMIKFLDCITIKQLQQSLDIHQIQLDYGIFQSSKLATYTNCSKDRRKQKKERKEEDYLHDKIQLISQKMNKFCSSYAYSTSNVMELITVMILVVVTAIMFLNISRSANNIQSSISKFMNPITQAELVHNRILLEQQILTFTIQSDYFPDNLCESYGINNITAYITAKMYEDLLNNTDEFIKSLSELSDYQTIDDNVYLRQFESVPYLMNPAKMVSYQKYIQLMKSQTFDWVMDVDKQRLNPSFYSGLFPQILLDSTIDKYTSLTNVTQMDWLSYIQDIYRYIAEVRIICILMGLLVLFSLAFLRIKDSIFIIEYLLLAENIDHDLLNKRYKQLKSAISQLDQLRSNRLESLEFDHTLSVDIKYNKRQAENIEIQQFAEWQTNQHNHYQMKQTDIHISESMRNQSNKLIDNIEETKKRNKIFRIIQFKRLYLFILICAISTFIITANYSLSLYQNRIDNFVLCDQASKQLSKIQQKIINIIAYSWLKVFSLHQSISMDSSNIMYNQAIDALLASEYQTNISIAYSKTLSDQILYGNICQYFKNQGRCLAYRNNIFSSGFTVLIPLVVKQSVQINEISSNYSYYIDNLCDKTWLLFEGVAPLTKNIASKGYLDMNQDTQQGINQTQIQGIMALVSIVLITLLFQYRRYLREKYIKQEIFSLETVENLYHVAQYKPFFNEVYYS